jgi:hypothetical protein
LDEEVRSGIRFLSEIAATDFHGSMSEESWKPGLLYRTNVLNSRGRKIIMPK